MILKQRFLRIVMRGDSDRTLKVRRIFEKRNAIPASYHSCIVARLPIKTSSHSHLAVGFARLGRTTSEARLLRLCHPPGLSGALARVWPANDASIASCAIQIATRFAIQVVAFAHRLVIFIGRTLVRPIQLPCSHVAAHSRQETQDS